ncbi:class I adenylate-forming enzyme family protein, partial [Mycolicibacterium peregrinum]
MKAGDAAHAADAAHYRTAGWWSDRTLSQTVREHALAQPDKPAYVDYPNTTFTWREFDRAASLLAAQLAGLGVTLGDRVAVWHGDTAAIHVLFVAIERCGAVVVGIGARAGTREATQILRTTEPRLLISDAARHASAQTTVSGLTDEISALVLDGLSLDTDTAPRPPAAGVGADDVFLINSTSGTTGLPKCVVHTQN